MKKQILFLLVFCASISTFSQFQQSKAIDSIFSEWDQPDVPGCALGIFKDGKLVYSKGYGLANMEYDIPNSGASVFRIGSTSKQFTAACIVRLVEQGKLNFDDTLKNLFPDFPDYAEKITIRHLLNHTSGIRDYLQLSYLKGIADDDYYEDADVMNWLIHQSDLNFAPGDEYLYSNSGYWLLGQIVNKVAGKNMADYAQEQLFGPLGMDITHFHNDFTRIVKNRATGYAPTDSNAYQISMTTLNMIGDGGIFTSINDIKKWDDAYYNSNVLSKEFWKMMTQQGVLNNGEKIDYASGLIISDYKGLKTISHGGAFVGFRAELMRFPEQRLSVAIFANRADANPSLKAYQVADILLKDQFIEKVIEVEKVVVLEEEFPLEKLIGNYEIQPGVIAQLKIQNDTLNLVQTWNKKSYNIVKTIGNTYEIPTEKGISFSFSNLKDGGAQTLTILQGGNTTKASRKKDIDTSGVDLTDYAGSYFSKELDVTYVFEIKNGTLIASINDTQQPMDCRISDMDKFTMKMGLVRFRRTNGTISGFDLDSGRVKNLKFQKI